jgi:hypothetical protein
LRSPLSRSSVLLLGVVLADCGGGSPAVPTPSLPALERLAIAQQVVSTALHGLTPGNFAALSVDAPLSSIACEQTCGGATCTVTCPVDERLQCPGGGTATDRGAVVGTLDQSLTGEATLETRQAYANCRTESGVTLNGAPGTTATGTARFVNGELAGEQSARVSGAVGYASAEGSGQCAVDIRVTFTPGGGGSARGSACDGPVDVAF